MYCLANICYVCLENKNKLISDINSSSFVNKDLIHIIGYLPCNLAWIKTMQMILICEECCSRLRETHQFLAKCSKNSAQLRSYVDNLNTTPISNTGNKAELLVKLNSTVKHENHNGNCEIQSDEDINTFQWRANIEKIEDVCVDFEHSLITKGIICKQEAVDEQHNNSTEIIEENEDGVVNLEDYFVKEADTWKREVDVTEEYPLDNNSTENMDNEADSGIATSNNAHLTTDTASVSSALTCKQVHHATNKKDLSTASPKSFQCSICNKCLSYYSHLVIHMRVHSGEKPYSCTTCKRCFTRRWTLVRHMRVLHTGEKP